MNYRMVFEESERDSNESLVGLLSSYLRVFDKQPEIGERLKNDQLIESDLFFLRGYCSRVGAYRKRKFQFLRAN